MINEARLWACERVGVGGLARQWSKGMGVLGCDKSVEGARVWRGGGRECMDPCLEIGERGGERGGESLQSGGGMDRGRDVRAASPGDGRCEEK